MRLQALRHPCDYGPTTGVISGEPPKKPLPPTSTHLSAYFGSTTPKSTRSIRPKRATATAMIQSSNVTDISQRSSMDSPPRVSRPIAGSSRRAVCSEVERACSVVAILPGATVRWSYSPPGFRCRIPPRTGGVLFRSAVARFRPILPHRRLRRASIQPRHAVARLREPHEHVRVMARDDQSRVGRSCFIRSCAARFDLASSVAVIGTCLSRFSYR